MEKLYHLFEQYQYRPNKDNFLQGSLLDTLANIQELVDGYKLSYEEDYRSKSLRESEFNIEISSLNEERDLHIQEKELLAFQNERLQRIISVDRDQINELRRRIAELEKQEKLLSTEIKTQLQKSLELERKLIQKETELSNLRKSTIDFEKNQVCVIENTLYN